MMHDMITHSGSWYWASLHLLVILGLLLVIIVALVQMLRRKFQGPSSKPENRYEQADNRGRFDAKSSDRTGGLRPGSGKRADG